jgi:hypothetical protein
LPACRAPPAPAPHAPLARQRRVRPPPPRARAKRSVAHARRWRWPAHPLPRAHAGSDAAQTQALLERKGKKGDKAKGKFTDAEVTPMADVD